MLALLLLFRYCGRVKLITAVGQHRLPTLLLWLLLLLWLCVLEVVVVGCVSKLWPLQTDWPFFL